MTRLVVIPARWGSTRLPGKPLRAIAGRTLLSRTIDLARRGLRNGPEATLVVATDDERIAAAARQAGCAAVMTDAHLSSGSARALAAALQQVPLPQHVLNLQGDAPFLPTETISLIFAALDDGAPVATPVTRLDWAELDAMRRHKEVAPFSGTTCAIGPDGDALWFSKRIIPALRDEDVLRAGSHLSPVHRHLGLYGYSLAALRRFHAMPPTAYEQWEGLEQLRFVESGVRIRTVAVASPAIAMSGIDTEHDLLMAEMLIASHGDPYGT